MLRAETEQSSSQNRAATKGVQNWCAKSIGATLENCATISEATNRAGDGHASEAF
jgi:hypothetical protein